MGAETPVVWNGRGAYCSYEFPSGGMPEFAAVRRAQALCVLNDSRVLFARSIVLQKLNSLEKMLEMAEWLTNALREEIVHAAADALHAGRVDQLMGIEGAISRKMFEELERRVPPRFGFHGRNRRPPLDPVNAYISYCNCIVYALCVPALAKAGLNTAVGFLHEPGAGRHTLALDKAEGLKPLLADLTLAALIRHQRFEPDMTETTPFGCFLNKTGRKAAREAMIGAMHWMFGIDEESDWGWPKSLWQALERYALDIAGSVLRRTPDFRWSFVDFKGGGAGCTAFFSTM
jgi:CRISPR-associated endonuclease Cas1